MQQYQQRIPSFSQPEFPFSNIAVGQPTCVPQVHPRNQSLVPLLPLLASVLQLEIQNQAQYSPGRMLTFNLHAANNFQNPQFAELFIHCVMMLDAELATRPQHPGQLIEAFVPSYITLRVGRAVVQYLAYLQQVLDPATINEARIAEQRLQQMEQNAQRALGMVQQPQYQQPAQFPSNYGQQQPFVPANAPQQYQAVYQPTAPLLQGANTFNRSYVQNESQPQFAPNPNVEVGRRFGTGENPQPEVQAMPFSRASAFAPAPAPVPEPQPLPQTDELVWHSSEEQRVRKLYSNLTHYEELRLTPSGNVIQIIHERIPGVKLEDHQGISKASLANYVPRSEATERRMIERNHTFLMAIRKQTEDEISKETLQDVPTPETLEAVQADTVDVQALSMDELWTRAELAELRDGEGHSYTRVEGEVLDVLPVKENLSKEVQALAKAESFAEVLDLLNGEDGVDSWRDLHPALFHWVNDRMTALANRVIKQNLSIDGLSMSSFAEDWEIVANILAEDYSDTTLRLLFANQKRLLANQFGTVDTDLNQDIQARLMLDLNMPIEDYPEIRLIAFKQRASVTFTKVSLEELGINVEPNAPFLLEPELLPVFAHLIDDLKRLKHRAGEYDRHYLRTSDRRVFEVTNGFLNSGAWLLTLK